MLYGLDLGWISLLIFMFICPKSMISIKFASTMFLFVQGVMLIRRGFSVHHQILKNLLVEESVNILFSSINSLDKSCNLSFRIDITV